ncbi:3'-5' exonuclease [Bordetella genomosp. 1]|uniref:DNA polymerase III subunit epsilon n=1 Tax=Bordetella genomosp. 1 TaxID=1395607 RepID=A0ABX4ET95_9BORD|nr:3'-5' exonuclease [Bordetella genomosp. 1]MDQ8032726.1 3'-5' exonuclease [Bordetella sp.]OZI57015.1 DNA polymerase III subunit epsilon [Bordetella genomosp. 1]
MTYFRRSRSPASSATPRPSARAAAPLTAALAALEGPFWVADLETTGLSAASCEILEFAAVSVSAGGQIEREFSRVVRVGAPVPSFISRLTGISQREVDRDGLPVMQAFDEFLGFIEGGPVFFHNASFDTRFLRATAERLGRVFETPIHCTLQLARRAWPELPSHKLGLLASHIGASEPTHRALADVRTTVAVALAARQRLAA